MSAKFSASSAGSSRPGTMPGVCGLGAMDLSRLPVPKLA
jgi:hypothetical protein